MQIKFDKLEEGEKVREIDTWFNTTTCSLHYFAELHDLLTRNFQEIESKFDSFVFQGSGWVFSKVLKMALTVVKFNPLSGGGNKNGQSLPLDIKKRRGAIDLSFKSDKEQWFLQCINRFYAKQNIDRDIDISNLSFPTLVNQIQLFEKRNHLSICVFGWQEKEKRLCVYYLTKQPRKKCIDLLLWEDHFYLINDLSRLIGCRWHKRNRKKIVGLVYAITLLKRD